MLIVRGATPGLAEDRRGTLGVPRLGSPASGCQAGQGFDDRTFLKLLNRMVGCPLAAG